MGDLRIQEAKERSDHSSERGVTLVELLTVVAIIGIAVGIPLTTMIHERKRITLDEGHATVLHALSTARTRAIAGAGGVSVDGHVVCVRENSVEVLTTTMCPTDCTCSGGEVRPMPPGVTAEDLQFTFERLSGASTEQSVIISGFDSTRTITVSDHGFIQ